MDNLLYMKPFRGIIFNSLQRENQTYPKLENLPAIPFSEGFIHGITGRIRIYTDP
jgi:hypothetical protein